METINVAVLIEALNLVGQIYRNKKGSQPADAIKKILQQLDGAGDITLAEWVEARQKKPKAAAKRKVKPRAGAVTPEQALARMERAETQAALRETIASVTLSADQWKALAKNVIGRSGRTGPVARDALETYFSDRLLLEERIEGVKRQYNSATQPPAAAS